MSEVYYNKVKVSWLVRVLLLLVTYHSSLITSFAQVGEYRTDLALGLSAGYVSSNVGFVPEVPQNRLGGMTFGLTARYTCEKYFKSICSVVVEANVVQTGWKENIQDVDNGPVYLASDPGKTSPLYYERHMTYLQVPFLARMGWGRERRGLQGFIVLGPQLGYLLGESTKTNFSYTEPTLTERSSKVVTQDSLPIQRKFDYGIVAGAGMELSVKNVGHFIIEGRYYYGLGDFFNNTKSDYFGRSNFGQIMVKATYLFDIVRTKNDRIK